MRYPIVIYYHQLVREACPAHALLGAAVTPERFRADMIHLKERYRVLHMDEFCAGWEGGGRWPARCALVTFDDGFRNCLWAARILHELGLSATFFVITDTIDTTYIPADVRFLGMLGTRNHGVFETRAGRVDLADGRGAALWRARVLEALLARAPTERETLLGELAERLELDPLPPGDENYAYLTSADLRELCALDMTIGSHGLRHEKLARCSDAELEAELFNSREQLRALTGQPVDALAYPFGRFNARVRAAAARCYRVAFGGIPEHSPRDRYAYPRANAAPGIRQALNPWLPLKRRSIRRLKTLLGRPSVRWDT